ncbi:hypothetical protein [Prauserella endophytica]|uniref:Uncharacterized protein n=1 Tax=Prauserella endophytica TaxID=1592324 RepID=A0ABY2RSJ9_9PSEU|nr:hypothetical protein [Prauserella endophytica]TKG58543.1 hypothetical protein FCN18_37810 [Prauserella endophytica]
MSPLEHERGAAAPDLGNFRGGLVAGTTPAAFATVSGGVLALALADKTVAALQDPVEAASPGDRGGRKKSGCGPVR